LLKWPSHANSQATSTPTLHKPDSLSSTLYVCANAPNFLIYGSPKCGKTDFWFLPTNKVGELQLYSLSVPF